MQARLDEQPPELVTDSRPRAYGYLRLPDGPEDRPPGVLEACMRHFAGRHDGAQWPSHLGHCLLGDRGLVVPLQPGHQLAHLRPGRAVAAHLPAPARWDRGRPACCR